MDEVIFSQMKSRSICKYLNKQYSIKIKDSFEFWGHTPETVQEYLKDEFDIKVSITEILKAARV